MSTAIVKMNGLGNNFVLVDHRKPFLKDPAASAKKICDVHFGVGADGLILVENSEKSDLRMRIFNADGSEPEMCGNGIRCFSRFASDEKIFAGNKMRVETLAGEKITEILPNGLVRVDMGEPVLANRDINPKQVKAVGKLGLTAASIAGESYHYVSMGNPHAVRFVKDYDFDYKKVGEAVETNRSIFPNKTNVEFIRVENPSELTMRVWERGCGETFACGTGACASVAAAILSGQANPGKVKIHLLGGDLEIEWSGKGNLFMTGPAETVLRGEYLN